jgi:hemerythrin-like domain-containing protein
MMTTIEDLLGGDHSELDKLLDSVLVSLEAGNATIAHRRLDLFWARLAMHIRAEHLHLFPALDGASADVEAQLEALRADHNFFMRELVDAIKMMRNASTAGDATTLKVVADRMHILKERLARHNAIEETEIYMLPDKVLRTDVCERMARSMRAELENLPPRFADGTN